MKICYKGFKHYIIPTRDNNKPSHTFDNRSSLVLTFYFLWALGKLKRGFACLLTTRLFKIWDKNCQYLFLQRWLQDFHTMGCKLNRTKMSRVRPAGGVGAKTGGIYARVKRNEMDLEAAEGEKMVGRKESCSGGGCLCRDRHRL